MSEVDENDSRFSNVTKFQIVAFFLLPRMMVQNLPVAEPSATGFDYIDNTIRSDYLDW